MSHYTHGVDCLGAVVKEWDNHVTFQPGDVVYYAQKYWRAAREIDPPAVPAFQDGEVPGQSSGWRQISSPDVMGAGSGFDLSSWGKALAGLTGGNKTPAPAPPPSAVMEKHARASAGTAAFYTALGVTGLSILSLGGYLLLRKKRK